MFDTQYEPLCGTCDACSRKMPQNDLINVRDREYGQLRDVCPECVDVCFWDEPNGGDD